MRRKSLFFFFMALVSVGLLVLIVGAFAWAENPKQTPASSPSPSSSPAPNMPPTVSPPGMGPGGPPSGMMMGASRRYGSPEMTVSGNYVYILQSGVLYQFTVNGLKLKAKTSVGDHHGMSMGKCPCCTKCQKICPVCPECGKKCPSCKKVCPCCQKDIKKTPEKKK